MTTTRSRRYLGAALLISLVIFAAGCGNGTDANIVPQVILPASVWIPDFFGNLVRFRNGEDPNTTVVTLMTPGCSPNSVAVIGAQLFVACNATNQIQVFDANAVRAAASGSTLNNPPQKTIASNQFNNLIGLAPDGQRNLWVASFGNSEILRISAASLATPNPVPDSNPLVNRPSAPVSLVFATDGSLWVVGQDATRGNGILVNIPATELGNGANAIFRLCIANSGTQCQTQAGLFNSPEGIALFSQRVWVSNNGGNAPAKQIIGISVINNQLVNDFTFGPQNSPFQCPGGMFGSIQHLWVNDEGFGDASVNPSCGGTALDQASGVGAILRFTGPLLGAKSTDNNQIVRFSNVTSRPGFGGIFVEND